MRITMAVADAREKRDDGRRRVMSLIAYPIHTPSATKAEYQLFMIVIKRIALMDESVTIRRRGI